MTTGNKGNKRGIVVPVIKNNKGAKHYFRKYQVTLRSVACTQLLQSLICGEIRFLSYFLVDTVIHLCILVREGLFERPRPFIFSPIISLLDCEKMKRKKCFVTIRGPSIRYLCGRLRGTASHSPKACSTTSSCLWLTTRQ